MAQTVEEAFYKRSRLSKIIPAVTFLCPAGIFFLLFYVGKFQPVIRTVTPVETANSYDPVKYHRDPNCQYTTVDPGCDQITESHPDDKH